MTVLTNRDANVTVADLGNGKNQIYVELLTDQLFMPIGTCETSYPLSMINRILELNGPASLCDELMREESPDYVQRSLKFDILSYIDDKDFENKTLLDFGCGSGASTMILARMFPQTEIVGVELEENLLSIAKIRKNHYGYNNIHFLISPSPEELPPAISDFDYIVMSAVYEHLLPREREILFPKIWDILKLGGILFLNQTPYRYYPVETHTTSGLPLINYLPDKVALFYAQRFSKRKLRNNSWEQLLRMGIRGGSIREIWTILNYPPYTPVLLEPSKLGVEDRIDLWYMSSGRSRSAKIMKFTRYLARFMKMFTGITIIPNLSLAIKKANMN